MADTTFVLPDYGSLRADYKISTYLNKINLVANGNASDSFYLNKWIFTKVG